MVMIICKAISLSLPKMQSCFKIQLTVNEDICIIFVANVQLACGLWLGSKQHIHDHMFGQKCKPACANIFGTCSCFILITHQSPVTLVNNSSK